MKIKVRTSKKDVAVISKALSMTSFSPEIKTRLVLVYFGRRSLTKELLPYARRIKCLRPAVRAQRTRWESYLRARKRKRRLAVKVATQRRKNKIEGALTAGYMHAVARRQGLIG